MTHFGVSYGRGCVRIIGGVGDLGDFVCLDSGIQLVRPSLGHLSRIGDVRWESFRPVSGLDVFVLVPSSAMSQLKTTNQVYQLPGILALRLNLHQPLLHLKPA
jgi:hypothetical protein